MATWVTHLMVVDKLYEMGLKLDERGFCVGNVGPDCNVENEDWTSFMPSREITHWMTVKDKKSSTDYEEFYRRYIEPNKNATDEEIAFLIGYYAHLIMDMQTQIFNREPNRIKAVYERIESNNEMRLRIEGKAKTMDTLKNEFGFGFMKSDICYIERDYLQEHPKSKFETVLRKVNKFSDYLDYFPKGAFTRKLKIIDEVYDFSELGNTPEVLYFWSKDEYMKYVDDASELIYEKIKHIL